MAISKLTLIGGSAGLISAIAGGVAIYLNSGESIRDHIANKSDSNIKFISLVEEAKEALKTRYQQGSKNKPKNDNVEIGKEQIIEWCEKTASAKFSSESDEIYLSLKTWCFVDTTSLSEKARKNNDIEYISDKNGSDNAWKTAWDTYKAGKTKDGLEITDSNLADLNKSDRDKGAVALHDWCRKTNNVKEYEVNSEATYKRYEKWCFKARQK